MRDELILRIDGQRTVSEEVVLHFQTNPFPGGHRFEMVIPRKGISKEIWEYARFQDAENPSEELARDWFFWLPSILHGKPVSETIRAKFVLNTIQRMRVGPEDVFLQGDCSPLIKKA